jgi:hypothetical protein
MAYDGAALVTSGHWLQGLHLCVHYDNASVAAVLKAKRGMTKAGVLMLVQVSLAALALLQVCINICPGVLESNLEKLMPLLFLKLCAGKQSVRSAAEAALQGEGGRPQFCLAVGVCLLLSSC